MSVGNVASDVAFLIQLAESIYSICKNATPSFGHVSKDVASLGAVLTRTEEVVTSHSLSSKQQERFDTVLKGCQAILDELHTLLEKYRNAAAQSKASWDRDRWHAAEIDSLRTDIVNQAVTLNAIVSQLKIELTLDGCLKELRAGNEASRTVFVRAVESIDTNDRDIRRILEQAGIRSPTFDANKELIENFLTRAITGGLHDEQAPEEAHQHENLPAGDVDDMGDLYESSILDPAERIRDGDDVSTHSATISETAPIRGEGVAQQEKRGKLLTSLLNVPGRRGKDLNTTPTPKPKLHRLTTLGRSSHPKSELATYAKEGNLLAMNGFLQDLAKREQVTDHDLGEMLFDQCLSGPLDIFVCKLLLDQGADPNFPGKAKHTPLNITIWRDDSEHLIGPMMSLLVEYGADINRRTGKESFTPLANMLSRNYTDRAHMLLRLGADTEADIGKGNKVMHLVAKKIPCSYFYMLLNYGANYDAVNDDGQTPLHIAASVCNEDFVAQLLSVGAQRRIVDKKGRTPVMMLQKQRIMFQHRRVWLLLVRPPGQIDATDDSGNTLLTYAVADMDVEQVYFLLFEADADPLAPNAHKQTPLNNATAILRSMELSSRSILKSSDDLKAVRQIVEMLKHAISFRTLQESQQAYG